MTESVKYKVTAIKYSLFRDVTQDRLLITYQRFWTTCRSKLQLSSSPNDTASVTSLPSVHSRVIITMMMTMMMMVIIIIIIRDRLKNYMF
jgi:hypothetical protein